jgi:transposase
MNEMDTIRVEEFRQLKREIRGSTEHLIVGIDVGKDKHHAFFGTATGEVLWRRFFFDNDREGFEWLLIKTELLEVEHGLDKVVFGMEPTADYHKPLGEYLIKREQMVVLVSGTAVKRNRELLDGRWDKNDTKDPANVADLISQGKFLFYDYPDERLRDLRGLLSLRRRLKRQEHGFRVRIRNHLIAQYFPEFDRYFGYSESLGVVRWCLDPSIIRDLEYEEFVELVAPGRRSLSQSHRLEAIWKSAFESIGCSAGEAVDFEGKVMVEALKHFQEAKRATDEKIQELCVDVPEYGFLLSIPGFGPKVSAAVVGAIGNPFRFRTHKEVLKLAGLDLSAERSGKNADRVVPVISKKGKGDLRYALYQAALIASSRNRHFIAWFTDKLRGREKEKGIKTKMRVKLSAKLLRIAWSLMKKKEPFDPKHLKNE